MLRTLTTIKSLLLLLFISVSISQTVVMQGILRDPNGKTVVDAPYSLTFKVYDVAISGEALWTETQGSVGVEHGVFSVELGSVTAMNTLTFSTQYYVGISVEGGQELQPRIKLASVPTSFGVLGVNNVFPSSGNVGVGTTDPQALLHIEQIGVDQDLLKIDNGASILKVTSNGDLYIPNSINFTDGSILSTAQGGTASSLSSAGNAVIVSDNNDDATGDIQFRIGESSKMVIKNSGNVGISTDTPLHALHVNDNVADTDASTAVAMFENTGGSAVINIKSSSDYTGVKFLKGDNEKWWIGQNATNDFYIFDYSGYGVKMKFWDNDDISLYGDDINLNANSHVYGTLDVTGNTGITGTFGVTGNTDITGTLDVTGNTDITGTLDVASSSGHSYINVSALAGSAAGMRFQEAGTNKWNIIKNSDNTLSIYNYANTGGALDKMNFGSDDIQMNFNGNNKAIKFGLGTGADGYTEQSIYPSANLDGNIGLPSYAWYEGHIKYFYNTSTYALSDRSTKQNIQSLVENRSNSTNLDKVLALNPVKYDINIDTHPFYKNVDMKEGELEESKDNLGFIAQELMEVIPEMVKFNESYQLYTIKNYEQMFPVLVGAMQEMKAENDDLKSRIERLEVSIGE